MVADPLQFIVRNKNEKFEKRFFPELSHIKANEDSDDDSDDKENEKVSDHT